MKARAGEVDRYCQALPPGAAVVVLHGPNAERIRRGGREIAAQWSDAEVVRLTGDTVRREPDQLVMALKTPSLLAGRTVVMITEGGDGVMAALERAMPFHPKDARVVVMAGALSPGSRLRKTAEAAADFLALGCYDETPAQAAVRLRAYIEGMGATISPGDARAVIQMRAGQYEDLEQLVQQALLLAYPRTTLTQEGMAAVLVPPAEREDRLKAYGFLMGRRVQMDEALLAMARMILWRVFWVHQHMAGGKSAKEAMKALRPPVFFKEEAAFSGVLQRYSAAKVLKALARLQDRELSWREDPAYGAMVFP